MTANMNSPSQTHIISYHYCSASISKDQQRENRTFHIIHDVAKPAQCLYNSLIAVNLHFHPLLLFLFLLPFLLWPLCLVPGLTMECNLARLGDRRERLKQKEAARHRVKEALRDIEETLTMPECRRRAGC